LTTIQEVRPIAKEPRVNDKIRAREVRLVDPDGGQIGIKSIEEARWLADQLDYDLVEVAPDARPPVVRLMDYGKYKYEESVKRREARKKQTRTVIKEVQFRPKIGEADFDVKLKRVIRFLGEGDKVKCTMRFRGREVTHPEIGYAILQRLAQTVEDLGEVELRPRLDGRQMTMVLVPTRRPEPKHEATPDGEVAPGPADAEAEAPSNGSPQPEAVIGEMASEEPAVEARDQPAEDEDPAAE
jgi:translation initiation factor IF-3